MSNVGISIPNTVKPLLKNKGLFNLWKNPNCCRWCNVATRMPCFKIKLQMFFSDYILWKLQHAKKKIAEYLIHKDCDVY